MAKVVGMGVDESLDDFTVDSSRTLVRNNGYIVVIEYTGRDLHL